MSGPAPDPKARARALCALAQKTIAKACPLPYRVDPESTGGDFGITVCSAWESRKGGLTSWPKGSYMTAELQSDSDRPRGTARLLAKAPNLLRELTADVVPALLARIAALEETEALVLAHRAARAAHAAALREHHTAHDAAIAEGAIEDLGGDAAYRKIPGRSAPLLDAATARCELTARARTAALAALDGDSTDGR